MRASHTRRLLGGGVVSFEAVRARLNLWAVLPNLEDVARYDPEMGALVRGACLTVQFRVARGPAAFVRFGDGACTVGKGEVASRGGDAKVVLWFASPRHLNKMFDGKGQPVPLKGFKHLGFLKNEFTQLTDRMAYYLKPTEELLQHPAYLALNTRLTLNTAMRAVPVLLAHDPDAQHFRAALASGSVALEVMPDGPNVGLLLGPAIRPVEGDVEKPSALIRMRSLEIANAFLNGRLDTFAAVAEGDVEVWGQIPKIDALGLVLDRIPKYLS
jgi:hypothetical protein